MAILIDDQKETIGTGVGVDDDLTDLPNDGGELTGPYFDANIPNNVTAIVGKSAFLRCKVRNLGNKTVRMTKFCKHRDINDST